MPPIRTNITVPLVLSEGAWSNMVPVVLACGTCMLLTRVCPWLHPGFLFSGAPGGRKEVGPVVINYLSSPSMRICKNKVLVIPSIGKVQGMRNNCNLLRRLGFQLVCLNIKQVRHKIKVR